jgi:hypothetical protein
MPNKYTPQVIGFVELVAEGKAPDYNESIVSQFARNLSHAPGVRESVLATLHEYIDENAGSLPHEAAISQIISSIEDTPVVDSTYLDLELANAFLTNWNNLADAIWSLGGSAAPPE